MQFHLTFSLKSIKLFIVYGCIKYDNETYFEIHSNAHFLLFKWLYYLMGGI